MLDLLSPRVDGLRDAIQTRGLSPGWVHHEGRGRPHASSEHIAELERCSMIRSMSPKGDRWDNAVAESFFSTLKTEDLSKNRPIRLLGTPG